MSKDLEEIMSIIAAADEMQARLNVLEKRRSFTLEQQQAILDAGNCVRGLTAYQLSKLLAAFDPEYDREMKRLTIAGKR